MMSSQLLCPVKDGPNEGRLLLWELSGSIPRQRPEHFGNTAPHLQVKEIRLCACFGFLPTNPLQKGRIAYREAERVPIILMGNP